MLTVTHLCGLGGGGTTRPEYTLNLGSCYNLELFDWVKSASGWNGVNPCKVTVNIVSGAIVGATSTGYYALYVRNFPAVCELAINNYSWIVGCGGAGGSGCYSNNVPRFFSGSAGGQGGPAIYAGSAFKFDNRGVIGAGGGGGGGGGIQSIGQYYNDGSTYYVYTGTGGGGGAGTSPGGGGAGGGGGGVHYTGAAGGAGSLNAGGASGLGGTFYYGGYSATNPCPRGGNGGGLGQAGGAGAGGVNQGNNVIAANPALAGLSGGATNYAVYGNGNITWIYSGDIRGWVA